MSKKYAEEKSKKKIVTIWKRFCLAFGFLTCQEISFLAKNRDWNLSQTHKNPLKTHIEALKIQNIPPNGRGGSLSRALPPLVPSALDDFLRWTTFDYAATALIGATRLVSLDILSKETGWESLRDRRYKHKMCQFYKMTNDLTPTYFTSLVPSTVENTSAYNLLKTTKLSKH